VCLLLSFLLLLIQEEFYVGEHVMVVSRSAKAFLVILCSYGVLNFVAVFIVVSELRSQIRLRKVKAHSEEPSHVLHRLCYLLKLQIEVVTQKGPKNLLIVIFSLVCLEEG
jgi:hypothetical protein